MYIQQFIKVCIDCPMTWYIFGDEEVPKFKEMVVWNSKMNGFKISPQTPRVNNQYKLNYISCEKNNSKAD